MGKTQEKKTPVERCAKLSIFVFRKAGALKHLFTSTYTWENYSSVWFSVFLDGKSSYIDVSYTFEPDLDFHYKIKLTKAFCKFGGSRWWFRCPNKRGSKICNKRVAMLYLPPYKEIFACRHCYNLTYESRNLYGMDKKFGRAIPFPVLDREEESIKRTFYRGVLTKRYKKHRDKCRKNIEHIRKRQEFYKKRLGMT